ncbi:transcriptional regulator [Filimonas zeae]|uniref:Transcriptional regulator n=2 Tax=Filimonas zeae TaxID=1737353 RepID=A0A917IQJ2_9BACT|nr:transcriptional regulator [Filimonas zeae]
MNMKRKYPDCGKKILAIHDAMDVLNGKWKVSIIACLCYKSMRYSELLREVKGISGKVLSRELKDLEINQLVQRNVQDTQPVTVSYEITDYGVTLKELTDVIAQWGFLHRERILSRKTN